MPTNIFKKRINLYPIEYPSLTKYKDAIRHSYWIHTEFNITSDIQDYKIILNDQERSIVTKSMLGIAQIEVNVKTFWGDVFKQLPKPEIADVGYTFAESEVRHKDAYKFLLEKLSLNSEFEKIKEIPAIIDRINYLSKYNQKTFTDDKQQYTLNILLFSLFIEHVSLFSQFYILMLFNKKQNLFKGISNIIEATSKEEQIHGLFGIELINIIKKENPQWFNQEFVNKINMFCKKALKAEKKILSWIFQDGQVDWINQDRIIEFVKNRLNNSLESIGFNPLFDIDENLLVDTTWFDLEILSSKEIDFFNKRPVDYCKKTKTVSIEDLF